MINEAGQPGPPLADGESASGCLGPVPFNRAGSNRAERSQADSRLANGFSVSCIALGPIHFHA